MFLGVLHIPPLPRYTESKQTVHYVDDWSVQSVVLREHSGVRTVSVPHSSVSGALDLRQHVQFTSVGVSLPWLHSEPTKIDKRLIYSSFFLSMSVLCTICFLATNCALFLRLLHSDGFLCPHVSKEQLGSFGEDVEYEEVERMEELSAEKSFMP